MPESPSPPNDCPDLWRARRIAARKLLAQASNAILDAYTALKFQGPEMDFVFDKITRAQRLLEGSDCG